MGNFLYRYLIVIIACASLLTGLQVPNFVDQYQKRVDAHLREVTINLRPYLEIAVKYFGGDLHKLIELHHNSTEKPFQEEGVAIEQMLERKQRFEADLAALNVSLPEKAWHVLLHGDREILDETLVQYSYAVPLNQEALVFGAGVSITLLLAVELLLALARFISNKISRTARNTNQLKVR